MSNHTHRGKGRGRPTIVQPPNQTLIQIPTETTNNTRSEPLIRQKRIPIKSAEDLRRVMDIIQSRISVIIDSLEGDDNDASLKRNVMTAVKHLKQINDLLL